MGCYPPNSTRSSPHPCPMDANFGGIRAGMAGKKIGPFRAERANLIFEVEPSMRWKLGLCPLSSNDPRKTDRHCPPAPSAEPPRRHPGSGGVPNVQTSTRTGRCAMSSIRQATGAAAKAVRARLPVAAPEEPGSRRWCSSQVLPGMSSHKPCCQRPPQESPPPRESSSSLSLSRPWSVWAAAGRKPHAIPVQSRSRREDQERCNMQE